MIPKLRAYFALAWLAAITVVALPLQIIAVKFGWGIAKSLPVWWHGKALRAAGLAVRVTGAPARERPLMIVANHASWADISVIASLMPCSFVAKSEVATWPLFGLFAKLQRCIFVERARRSKTAETAAEMADRLSDGDAIVLFPEGTSSDGNRVLPFRSALIGAAHAAISRGGHERVHVQAMSVAYTRLGGLPMSRSERPLVSWFGDMELPGHLWGVFLKGPIDVEVRFGEPIPVDGTTDRKVLTQTLELQVRAMTMAALHGRPLPHGGLPAPAEPRALAIVR
ncbi:lysophospholipid acyltransferase family protein [Methyloraptor flagellatus]|uniref:Lysophospholipid acyltransferase family protein n=1 Tax=Methyloraptor flagellatus TaxID=3162530 RepID=A0AAU7X795_9HYPH